MRLDNEKVLHEILEQSLAGYWDWNIPTGEEFLSPSFKKMFGYEDHEIANRADAWQQLIFSEDLPIVLDKYGEHIESGGKIPFYNEVRYHHKNGSTVWVICTGKVIEWDSDGKPVRMVGCHIDITERKKAEETLHIERDQLLSVYNSIDQAIYIADPNTYELIYVNQYIKNRLSANCIGEKCYKVLQGLDSPCPFCTNEIIMKQKPEPYHYEFHNKKFNMDFTIVDRIIRWPDGRDVRFELAINITERKRAEDTLKTRERRFEQLIQNSFDTIVILDANGIQRYVSPSAEKVHGYSSAELVDIPVIEQMIHPEDQPIVLEAFRKILINGEGGVQYRHRCKKGGWVYLEARGKNQLDNPDIQGIIVNVRDITENKRVEEDLKKSTTLYHDLVETSQDLIWQCDAAGRYIYLNPAWEKVFGYSVSEMMGKFFSDFQSVEQAKRDKEIFNGLLQSNGSVRGYETVHLNKDGKEIHLVFNAKAVYDEEKNAVGTRGTAYDITDRIKAEDALERTKIQLKESILQSPLPIVLASAADFKLQIINKATEDFLLIKSEDYLGKSLMEIDVVWQEFTPEGVKVNPGDLPLPRALQGLTTQNMEMRIERRDGSSVWEIASGAPIFDSQGKLIAGLLVIQNITDRKEMEEALRKSKDRLGLAMAVKNEGLWDWDILTNKTFFDERYYTMAGYNPGEFPQDFTAWASLVHPEDLPQAEQAIQNHFAGKSDFFDIEFRFKRKNGTWMWIQGRGQIVSRDEKGTPTRMVGTHMDITSRKMAEEELTLQKSYLTTIIENQPGLVWLKDNSGKFLSVNRAFAISCGMNDPESLIGKSDFEIWPKELAEKYQNDDQTVMDKAEQKTVEELISVQGVAHWFETFKSPVRNEEGKIVGTTGFARDITEKKQAAEALRNSESRLRTFVANQPGVAYIVDKDGIFKLSEGRGLDSLGLKPGQVVGMSVFEVYKDVPEICERIRLAMAGNEQQFQVNLGKMVFDSWAGPIVDNNGNISGVIGIATDISERKRTEEALANAQKLESLGVLAGGIAHDFNNLMTGIFGFVQIALETSTEEEVRESLMQVVQTIDRTRALTQQLLTFAKGGAPKLEVSPLFPFVQNSAQFALSGSNVSSRFDIEDGLWAANFDKNQIGQVIDNLVINAQQAMPLGGTITLSARNVTLEEKEHPVLKKGDYVKISVVDTGIGISKDLQKRIFDPFFTTKAKGHGLGLATCYSIINRHAGCIDVYSELGKGSTFNIYLPAVRETNPDSMTGKKKTHTGKGLFLIMDDEEVIRKTLATLFKSFGYEVACVSNGQEAIDYVAETMRLNKSLVGMLFDLTVPGAMGGKEAIEKIRKMGSTAPAFVASGYADDPIIEHPTDFGFTGSISKPFMRSELIELLEKHMKDRK